MRAFIHQCAVQGASPNTEPARTAARGGRRVGAEERGGLTGQVGSGKPAERKEPGRRGGRACVACASSSAGNWPGARCRHHTSLGRGKAASVRRAGEDEDGLPGGCGRRTC